MAEYRYRGKDPSGKSVRGKIRAMNIKEAFAALQQRRIFAYELLPEEEERFPRVRLKARALGEFSRQVGTMLSAGVPVTRAMTILVSQEKGEKKRLLYQRILQEITQGNSFSSALERCGGSFPNLMVNMFRAGEASGNLDQAAVKMAVFYEKEHRLNSKIKGAMTYPIILLFLTVAVTLILFTFVLPSFVGLLDESQVPLITKILLGISSLITGQWPWLLAGAVLLALAARYVLKIPEVAFRLDRWKLGLPVAGKLLAIIYTARFARTLQALYGSGVNMLDAIAGSAGTVGNRFLQAELREAGVKVREGNPLSGALEGIRGLDPKLIATVLIGEETGRLDNMLEVTASNYDEEADTATTRLISLLEPAMIVIMTIIVGIVLMGVMLPMMGSYSNFI